MKLNFSIFFIILACILPDQVSSQGENGVWLFGDGLGIQFHYPSNADPFPEVIFDSPFKGNIDVATYSHIIDEVAQPLFSTNGLEGYDSNGTHINPERNSEIISGIPGLAIINVMPQYSERVLYFTGKTYDSDFTDDNTALYLDHAFLENDLAIKIGNPISSAQSRKIKPIQAIVSAKGTCGNTWMITRNTIEIGNINEKFEDAFQIIEMHLIPPPWEDSPENFSKGFNFIRYILNPEPFHLGLPHTSKEHAIGRMRMSQDNERLAKTALPGYIELFDFNRTTGKLTNAVTLAENSDNPYGICFSPNDELLYSTESIELGIRSFRTSIYQYDLTLASTQSIIDSKTEIASFEGPTALVDMQITEHKQIFIGRENESFLSAITKPDERGAACAFEEIGIDLSPKIFKGPGLQNLIVIADDEVPEIDPNVLPKDTILCAGTVLDLKPKDGNIVCRWNDGSEVPSMEIDSAGTYWVQVNQNNKCVVFDTITISFQDNPVPELGQDTSICEGASVVLDPGLTDIDISWQDNSTDPQQTISDAGIYWVEADDNNCVVRDSIVISYLPSIVDIGNDTVICESTSHTLSVDIPSADITWQDNISAAEYEVTEAGSYTVLVNAGECTYRDTIEIQTQALPILDLGLDSTVCEERPVTLIPSTSGDSYLWQDGSTAQQYQVDEPGEYWLELSSDGCSTRDTILFTTQTEGCNCLAYIPNTFSPGDQNINASFSPFFSCPISSYDLRIFNRWGEEMFVSTELDLDWDGKFKSQEMPQGVYSYFLQYQFTSDPSVRKEAGTITILR